MIRRIRNVSMILICSVLTGTLLLVLTYLLPVDTARRHAEESLYEMVEVMADPEGSPLRKRIVDRKENFTDTLMVQNALEKVEGKGLLEHAMYVYHHDLEDGDAWRTEDSLVAFLRRGTGDMHLREYSRYWHGYLVLLKPLLILMSWRHVEVFLFLLHAALLTAVLAAAYLKKQAALGIGIVCTFLFMKPFHIWVSLAMSVCWIITLTAVLILLLAYEKIERKSRWEEFFLLVGIVTAYMDFLTYPILTLGIPLCVWLVRDRQGSGGWKNRLRKTFWNSACWTVGYIGMWGMKWVIAEILCRTGTLRDAAWAVIRRTSPLDGYSSAFSGVSRTFKAVLDQYDSVLYAVGFGLIVLLALFFAGLCLIKARSAEWAVSVLCLAVAALFPAGWLVLTQNHTAIHCIFTFRIMGVSVMALWCIACLSVGTLREERNMRENS